MNTYRSWVGAGARLALILGTLGLMACSDNDDDDGGNNNDNISDECTGDQTISVGLDDPPNAQGFAPLSVTFEGRVSLIADVSYAWTFDFGDGTTTSGLNTPRASHTYETPGTYEVKLTVNDETCGTEEIATTNIVVVAPVELTGDNMSARPGNITVLDQLQIDLSVLNESGSDLELPVTVSFFLANRPGVLWDEIPTLTPLTNVTLNADDGGVTIAAGGERDISETVDVPDDLPTGSYSVIAAIDLANEIGEEDDERNNIVASGAQVFIENSINDAADVLVENVQVGPSTAFQQLSAISINADLSNIGSRDADTSYTVFIQTNTDEFDPEQAVPVVTSEAFSLEFREPNNTFQVRAQQIVLPEPVELPEGVDELEVCVWVQVDASNVLVEENEENNLSRSETCVQLSNTPMDGVDIVLTNFDLGPTSTFLDGTVLIDLEVANFGTMPTRSFFCTIFLSEDDTLDTGTDIRLTNVNFSNLVENETRVVSSSSNVPGFLPVGVFNAFAFCDSSDVVRETIEENNIRRLDEQVTITAEAIIDLIASDINIEPAELEDGGDVTISATMTNDGTSGAGPAMLRVRRSIDTSCTSDDPVIGEGMIPPLGPSESAPIEIVSNGLLCDIFQPSYNLCIQVDPANDVPEIDENNNLTVLEDALSFLGARCNCETDDFEPNETPLDTVPITDGTYEDLTICAPGGEDNYAIDLEIGQSLAVRVNLAHTGECSNLDLELLDINREPIDDAISQTDGQLEQADLFLVQTAGRYGVRIKGRTGCDVNRYNMEVSIASPGPGVDLTGTDLIVNDLNPALAQEITASFRTLNIADDDAGAYDITLFLSTDTVIDETDFTLITERVGDGLQGARSRDDELTVPIPVAATEGAYFVCARLDNAEEVEEIDEDNNVICSEQIEVDTSCYDPFEVNDTPATATDIEPGTLENLNVCNQGRMDNYRFCVEDGTRVVARADFVHRDGDIDLRLLSDDEGNPEIGNSIGVRDFEEIELEYVNGEQCFILQVYLNDRNAVSNDYSLDLLVEPGDPLLRCDAFFEPNDTPDAAIASGADLTLAIHQEAALDRCPENDFDFYYVDLVAGPTVTLCAENDESNPQDFNINLALFDPNQAQLAANTGTNPCITRQLVTSGRYFVRVLSINPERRAVRYRMTLEGLFGVDLVGRDFTANPTDIIPGDFDTLTVYNFTLENARTDRAENIEYGIYYSVDPEINPLDDFLIDTRSIDAIDGFQELEIEDVVLLPEDGPYSAGEGYIGIVIDPQDTVEEENETNNVLQAQVNLLVCEDDAFEGNDSPANGAELLLDTPVEDLNICPNTEDWFCTDELAAGDYNSTATFTRDPNNSIGSDLNMAVIAVDENRVETAALGNALNLGDNATVEFTLDAPSRVCVRVFPLRPDGTNTYSLSLTGPIVE